MVTSSSSHGLDIVSIEQAEYESMLKTPAKPIRFPLNHECIELIHQMKTTLYALGGVGLAAPQVNHSLKIAVIYIPEEASILRDNAKTYPMHALINPDYTPVGGDTWSDIEACYSVRSLAGKVPRYKTINVSYQDEQGLRHRKMIHGFYARVLQHEIDHLNGVLISDRLTPDCLQGSIEDMMTLRRLELSDDKKALFDQIMSKKLKR